MRSYRSTSYVAEPTVVSLFSGCGGMDAGFATAGFRTVRAFDIDQAVVDVFNTNIAPVALVHDLSGPHPALERPDVLIAGSPCQGFSTSGKRDVSDPRNHLLMQAGRIAESLRPKVIVLENVPAAMSGGHAVHVEGVQDLLRWRGYNVRRFLADGRESGIPQLRKRLFLVAWRGSDCIRLEPALAAPKSLQDSLANLCGVTDHDPVLLPSASREALIAKRIPPGGKLSNVRASQVAVHTWDIPEVFGQVTPGEVEVLRAVQVLRRRERIRNFGDADPVHRANLQKHLSRGVKADVASLVGKGYLRERGDKVDLAHTYNGKYRRLHWDTPSPTVDTHFGDPALFLHPAEQRGMTPREAARIQGFDDRFVFAGSRRRKFKMIGNAVPPPMAARIGRFVRAALM